MHRCCLLAILGAAAPSFGGLEAAAPPARKLPTLALTFKLSSPAAARGIVASPDGKTLVTVADRFVTFWDAATGRPLRTLKDAVVPQSPNQKHLGRVFAVAFSPDGKMLASGGDDNAIRIWDVTTGKNLSLWRGERALNSTSKLAFSPDGKTLISSSPDVRLWDVATGKEKSCVRVPDARSNVVGFDDKGRPLALGRGSDSRARSGVLGVHDAATGKQVMEIKCHKDAVGCMVFRPDRKAIATGSRDGTARVWSLATGKLLASYALPRCRVATIAFSPDCKTAAVSYKHIEADNSDSLPERVAVKVFDAASGRELYTLEGKPAPSAPLAFATDGKTLAAAGFRSNEVQLWKLPAVKKKK